MNGKEDVLSAADFDRKYLERLFGLADKLEPYSGTRTPPDTSDPRYHEIRKIFAGHQLCSAFFGEGNSSASTRTKRSFELAMKRLGGGVISFSEKGSSIEKGESKERTFRNLDSYCDLFIIRDREEGSVAQAASVLKKPVINGGDGNNEHPTQWFLDAYSMQKFGLELDGLKIAFVGDLKGRVVNSNIKGLSHYRGVQVMGLYIPGCELPADRWLKSSYQEASMQNYVEALNDFNPDVIYWCRVQKNLGNEGEYSISPGDIEKLPKKAVWMHPQPIPDKELPPEFDMDRRALWFKQASYGVPVRMALIANVLGYADNVEWLFK